MSWLLLILVTILLLLCIFYNSRVIKLLYRYMKGKEKLNSIMSPVFKSITISLVASSIIALILKISITNKDAIFQVFQVSKIAFLISISFPILDAVVCFVAILLCYRLSNDMQNLVKHLFKLVLIWMSVTIFPSIPLVVAGFS